MGEAADHVVVFEDPLQEVGQRAHQTVAPTGLRSLLVRGGGNPDVDGLLCTAPVFDLDFPDARILSLEETDGCDEVRVFDLLHPFRESGGGCVGICSHNTTIYDKSPVLRWCEQIPTFLPFCRQVSRTESTIYRAIIYFSGKIHFRQKKDLFFGIVRESKGEKKKTHIKIFAKYLDLFCISNNYHYICSAIRCEFIDRKRRSPSRGGALSRAGFTAQQKTGRYGNIENYLFRFLLGSD